VNIGNNKITSKIPSEIGSISSLREMWLGRNSLSGTIPRELGNLMSVETIILEQNLLTGQLPNIFGKMSKLNVVNLGSNNLSGPIPSSFWEGNYETAALVQDNNFSGQVPENFCASVPNLKVDNSHWFLDEAKVTCSCCGDIQCNFWNIDNPTVAGTVRPMCPENNLLKINFDTRYWIKDNIVNETFYEFVALNLFDSKSFCMSPTGCYSFFDKSPERLKYNVGYSSQVNALLLQESCGSVNVCGIDFDKDHPKRNGLNHLTQITIEDLSILRDPSTPSYKALCSVMTEDLLFDELSVCDGTLLQRYVITLFFYTHKQDFSFKEFSSSATCEWSGVICDSSKMFVEVLDFQNANLTGTLTSEIGLLPRLQEISLGGNDLRGSIDESIFIHLPHLKYFDASRNNIKGTIPKTIFHLSSLKHMNVSNNLLEGRFPQGIEYSKSLSKWRFNDDTKRFFFFLI